MLSCFLKLTFASGGDAVKSVFFKYSVLTTTHRGHGMRIFNIEPESKLKRTAHAQGCCLPCLWVPSPLLPRLFSVRGRHLDLCCLLVFAHIYRADIISVQMRKEPIQRFKFTGITAKRHTLQDSDILYTNFLNTGQSS
jgi:hypothetical protein